MPFLQTSGVISIASLTSFFPGSGGAAMSNFYRGGGRVPSTKTVTVREPSPPGEYYSFNHIFWYTTGFDYSLYLKWNGIWVLWDAVGAGSATSYSVGGFTYVRGALNWDNTGYGGDGSRSYGIWRFSFVNQAINTGIPSSGQISLSNFYGAEKP